jgi:hypothetical protein
MKTEELINILSQSEPKKPIMTLGTLATCLIAVCGLITKLWLGLRPELDAMTITMSFCFKTLILSSLVLVSLHALKTSSVPLGKFTLKHFAVFLAVFLCASLVYEWMTTPVAQIANLFLLPNFKSCLVYVTLYGSFVSIPIFFMIKNSAPLHYESTAGLIGLASACISALGYSIHCPIDSPTFIVVAYGIPQLTLYIVSRLTFPHFLRW